MRILTNFAPRGLWALPLLLAAVAGTGHAAAADLSLGITAFPSPATQSNRVLYTLAFTNTSYPPLTGVSVAAQFRGVRAQFVSATNNFGNWTTNTASNLLVTFNVTSNLIAGSSVQFSFVVNPTEGGYLTNTATASGNSTVLLSTNLTLKVLPLVDLALGLVTPGTEAVVGDWLTYSLVVSNRGPSAASSLALTNTLPEGWRLLSVSPDSGLSYTVQGSNLVFTASSLASNATLRARVSMEPTNAGTALLSGILLGQDIFDPNLTNNIVVTPIIVSTLVTGQLVAVTVSTQRFDPQTGLMRQTIRVSNAGTSAVAGARVIITGFTNRVFNATGTNQGNPTVTLNRSLAPGESAELELEYIVPSRRAVADPVLVAVPITPAEPAVPSGTPLSLRGPFALGGGRLLIEWASVPGRSYTVLYSEDVAFTSPRAAVPTVKALADRTQWIDEGPPKTVSRPDSETQRYYRVVETP